MGKKKGKRKKELWSCRLSPWWKAICCQAAAEFAWNETKAKLERFPIHCLILPYSVCSVERDTRLALSDSSGQRLSYPDSFVGAGGQTPNIQHLFLGGEGWKAQQRTAGKKRHNFWVVILSVTDVPLNLWQISRVKCSNFLSGGRSYILDTRLVVPLAFPALPPVSLWSPTTPIHCHWCCCSDICAYKSKFSDTQMRYDFTAAVLQRRQNPIYIYLSPSPISFSLVLSLCLSFSVHIPLSY